MCLGTPGNAAPTCEIVFEVRNGVPVCTRLSLTADNEIGVRAKDLKAIKLEDLRDDIYGYIGVFTPNPAGGWVRKVGRGSYRQDREHVQQATTRANSPRNSSKRWPRYTAAHLAVAGSAL